MFYKNVKGSTDDLCYLFLNINVQQHLYGAENRTERGDKLILSIWKYSFVSYVQPFYLTNYGAVIRYFDIKTNQ